MRALVTGAQGFVGRYFVAELLATDSQAVVCGIGRSVRREDAFTHAVRWGSSTIAAPLPAALRYDRDPRYSYATVDIRDRESLERSVRDFGPDFIVHLASGLRDDDAARLVDTNVKGCLDLIEAIASANVPVSLVVLGSSGGIYGIPAHVPIPESAPCVPVDVYSATKLAGEHVARIAAARAGIRVAWARLFNLIGPGQDERHVCGRLAAQAAAIHRGIAPPVIEVGNLEATRDFIDVRDVARALLTLVTAGGAGEAYNVGSGKETSIGDVLEMTLRAAGISGAAQIKRLPPRAEDIPRHVADTRKLSQLGFQIRHPIETSIRDVVAYYLEETASAATAR